MAPKLVAFTIGYAGKTVEEFVAALQRAKVDRVIDVRALPLSRRRGFSKTGLKDALARSGIEYVHLRAAGNPYRDQKKDIQRCLALYAAHLDENPGVVDEVDAAIVGHRAALLCVEENACDCHRSVIAQRWLAKRPDGSIVDL